MYRSAATLRDAMRVLACITDQNPASVSSWYRLAGYSILSTYSKIFKSTIQLNPHENSLKGHELRLHTGMWGGQRVNEWPSGSHLMQLSPKTSVFLLHHPGTYQLRRCCSKLERTSGLGSGGRDLRRHIMALHKHFSNKWLSVLLYALLKCTFQ